MADGLDSSNLTAHFRHALESLSSLERPPADLLESLGGWPSVATLAPELVDDPLLGPLTALACRYAETLSSDAAARDATSALVGAVTATNDPGLFAQALNDLCNCAPFLEVAGEELAAAAYGLAAPPDPRLAMDPAEVSRHADALETYLRLTLANYGSKHRLFALFEDVKQPQPRRYAQAMVRAIATAFDHWDLDDYLIESIDVLAGAVGRRAGAVHDAGSASIDLQQTVDIAPDAAWATATIELTRALRAPSVDETITHLGRARSALAPVKGDEGAVDADVLDTTLQILSDFLISAVASGNGKWAIDAAAVAELEQLVRSYQVGAHGLHHWAGDRKKAVLTGWGRLARDLLYLREHLERESIYNAAVVLDDVLEIYNATTRRVPLRSSPANPISTASAVSSSPPSSAASPLALACSGTLRTTSTHSRRASTIQSRSATTARSRSSPPPAPCCTPPANDSPETIPNREKHWGGSGDASAPAR